MGRFTDPTSKTGGGRFTDPDPNANGNINWKGILIGTPFIVVFGIIMYLIFGC